jgi:hypothetical protein
MGTVVVLWSRRYTESDLPGWSVTGGTTLCGTKSSYCWLQVRRFSSLKRGADADVVAVAYAEASYCFWPASWKAWVNVGGCSTSCGTGTQCQTRDCSVCSGTCTLGAGKEEKYVTCSAGTQKSWGSWYDSGSDMWDRPATATSLVPRLPWFVLGQRVALRCLLGGRQQILEQLGQQR